MNEKLLFLIVSLVCLVIGALVGYYAIPRQENYKGASKSASFLCGGKFGKCPANMCCNSKGTCGITKEDCCKNNQYNFNGDDKIHIRVCKNISNPPVTFNPFDYTKPPSGPEPLPITTPPIPISGAEYCKNAYESCMNIHRR